MNIRQRRQRLFEKGAAQAARLDPDLVARELAYVADSGGLRRVWRSLRAAWRCSRAQRCEP